MSKYTTELRFICETYAGISGSDDDMSIEDVISASRQQLFNFNYPLFSEAYRATLETKIIRRYYTREIGFETVALFKHFLNMRLNEIMPYYNQLYESELLKFNPLIDTDIRHSGDKNTAQETSRDGTVTGNTTDKMTGGIADETTSTTADQRATDTTNAGTEQARRTAEDTTSKNGSRGSSTAEQSEHTAEDSRETNATDRRQAEAAESSSESTHETGGGSTSETSDRSEGSDSSKSSRSQDLYSDTPQGALNGLETNGYLTNARKISNTENLGVSTNGSETKTGSEEHTGDTTHSKDAGKAESEETRRTAGEAGTSKAADSRVSDAAEQYSEAGSAAHTDNDTKETASTGSTSERGRSDAQSVNTKTYDTVNAGTRSETSNDRTKTAGIESLIDYTFGKSAGSGTYSKMLAEFRETFLNIDMQILDNLNDLFMGVW